MLIGTDAACLATTLTHCFRLDNSAERNVVRAFA
jgi:hypothetical protein